MFNNVLPKIVPFMR